MRVTCEAPAATTGCLVLELKAKRQYEGEDTLEKGLAITKELKVGGFILEIVCTLRDMSCRQAWLCASPDVSSGGRKTPSSRDRTVVARCVACESCITIISAMSPP